MPKRTLDVFVPLGPLARLRQQILKERYKKHVPVKGATVRSKARQSLSSYMIDPKYLPAEMETVTRQRVADEPSTSAGTLQDSRLGQMEFWRKTGNWIVGWILGLYVATQGYIRRMASAIRAYFHARESQVTYTLKEGVTANRVVKLVNRAVISALALAVLVLLAIGFIRPHQANSPPGQPTQVTKSGGKGGVANAPSASSQTNSSSPVTNSAAATTNSSPTSQAVSPLVSGGRGSGDAINPQPANLTQTLSNKTDYLLGVIQNLPDPQIKL